MTPLPDESPAKAGKNVDNTEDTTPLSPWREFFRHNIRTSLTAAIFTVLIELGFYFVGEILQAGKLNSTLAALAAGAIWVPLASGPLSVGARDVFGGLLRGGIVADASAITLIVLWLTTPYLTFMAAVKIYCIYAAMAVFAVAAARFTLYKGGPTAGYTVAVAAAVLIFASLASPFWVEGPAGSVPPSLRDGVVEWSVYANPFYCVLAAVVRKTGYIWHEQGMMYETISHIRDFTPPAAKWYTSAVIHIAAAGVLSGLGLIFPNRSRS